MGHGTRTTGYCVSTMHSTTHCGPRFLRLGAWGRQMSSMRLLHRHVLPSFDGRSPRSTTPSSFFLLLRTCQGMPASAMADPRTSERPLPCCYAFRYPFRPFRIPFLGNIVPSEYHPFERRAMPSPPRLPSPDKLELFQGERDARVDGQGKGGRTGCGPRLPHGLADSAPYPLVPQAASSITRAGLTSKLHLSVTCLGLQSLDETGLSNPFVVSSAAPEALSSRQPAQHLRMP